MPRPSKGARLYRRKDSGQWVIIDGKTQRRTGTEDRRQAEAALSAYLATRDLPSGPSGPEGMTVAEALTIYAENHAETVADPARIGYAIDALLDWWGDLPVSSVTPATCLRYARERRAYRGTERERPIGTGTARRELGCLSAALSYCVKWGYLVRAPDVLLPEKKAPRERWLTRPEAAKLLRTARANKRTRHLCAFILIALYTGTRKEAILGLRFTPHTAGGWINTETGVMYRKAEDVRETKKRRPPVRMPRKLLGHAKRWERRQTWAVEYRGGRVGSIKNAWRTIVDDSGLSDVTPHTLKHTAITWAMHRGVPLADAAGFFGTSIATLEAVYLHHHVDFQKKTAAAMDRS